MDDPGVTGSLKASFDYAGKVTVNGAVQTSGVTANDFSEDVVYTFTSDGAGREFHIRFVCPQTTGLPVIKVDTQGEAAITSNETYIYTDVAVYDYENPAYSFTKTGYQEQIRGRGNTTWKYMPKKPYRIKFNAKTSMFGLTAAKSWVLLANYQDVTLIMNTIAFELGQRFGLPYTNHYVPVELFLNGAYQGSYLLTEQVQVGKGRVDIDEDEGFLVELDKHYDEEPKFTTANYNLPVMIKSPEDLDDSGYDFVRDAVNALDAAVYSDAFPNSGYRDLIDMDTFVDFILINEMLKNVELQNPSSVYMYRDKFADSKICLGPLWDFDYGFNYDWGYFANPEGMFKDTAFRGGPALAFFNRFFADPYFCTQYKAHWNAHYGEIAGITAFIDEQAALLEKSYLLDDLLWSRAHASQIAPMKAWWNERVSYLNGEINKY
jgi:hypothetical protein